MVQVKYVGKKPVTFDNVANSGKVWDGHGDVQEVTEAQAKVLTKYADQWALANDTDAGKVNAPLTTTVTGEGQQQVTVANSEIKDKALEKMNKNELLALAKAKYGKELDPAKGKKQLIDEIEELENEADPLGLAT
jgi:hypothetical protein